jgi:hypothetical protein
MQTCGTAGLKPVFEKFNLFFINGRGICNACGIKAQIKGLLPYFGGQTHSLDYTKIGWCA